MGVEPSLDFKALEFVCEAGELGNEIKKLIRVKNGNKGSLTSIQKIQDEVGDVLITEFRFSEAYSKSIEEKQIAEQSALTAINNTKRVKEEAVQAIEKAKGQAEAIQNSGGQSYIDLKTIEAWNGVLPTTMAGNSTPFIKLK